MDFFVIVITRNILYFPIVVVVQQKVLQYIFNRNHFKGKVRKKTRNPVLTHTNSCRTKGEGHFCASTRIVSKAYAQLGT